MWVVETHTDDFGRDHVQQSLQDGKADPGKWLADNAALIAASLASSEAQRNAALKLAGKPEAMVFEYADERAADFVIKSQVPEIAAKKAEAEAQAAVASIVSGIPLEPDAAVKGG